MRLLPIKALAAGFALAGAFSTGFAQEITGAGATFPAPLYAKWADAYNKATGARINYQSVGSGAGMRQIRGKTVDFGASDAPLNDADLAKDGLVQFPTVIGGVVPVINIQGIQSREMRLTGQVLGDIYLGKITKWNDPAIAALNPGVKLPDAAISPVRRADGSGTTFIFTNYLSKVNPDWKAKVGEGTAVNWPVGAGGKGNEGVSAFVQRLPNSIGYVEYAYAKQNKIPYVHDAERRRHLGGTGRRDVQGSCRRGRVAEIVQPGADQPGGQGGVADHRCDLHHDAHQAGQTAAGRCSTQVLRLGLRERRQDGR